MNIIYYAAPTETDQGATGKRTMKSLVDAIGVSKEATIVLAHNSNSNNTTYTLSTSLTITSNINLKIEKGALLSIATGQTLTINGPFESGLDQAFNLVGTGKVVFGGNIKSISPDWYKVNTVPGTTDMSTATQAAIVAAVAAKVPVSLAPGKSYAVVNLVPYDGMRIEGGGGALENKSRLVAIGGGSIFALSAAQTTGLEFDQIYFDSDTPASGTAIYGLGKLIARARFTGCIFARTLRYGLDCRIISSEFEWNQWGTYPAVAPVGYLFSSIRSGIAGSAIVESNANTFIKNEFAFSNAPFNLSIDSAAGWNFNGDIFEQNTNTGQTILVDRYNGSISFRGTHVEQNTTPYFIEVRNTDLAHYTATLVNFEDMLVLDPCTDSIAYFPDGITRLSINGAYGRLDCNLSEDSSAGHNTIGTLANANNLFLVVGTGATGVFENAEAKTQYTEPYIGAPEVRADALLVSSGSEATSNATPKTILTMSGAAGMWLVYAYNPGAVAALQANARVMWSGNNASIVAENGANLTITLSGADVQVTQTSGTSVTIAYKYIKLL